MEVLTRCNHKISIIHYTRHAKQTVLYICLSIFSLSRSPLLQHIVHTQTVPTRNVLESVAGRMQKETAQHAGSNNAYYWEELIHVMCKCVVLTCVYVCLCECPSPSVCSICRGQRRPLDPLELELKVMLNCLTWVLGTQPSSPSGARQGLLTLSYHSSRTNLYSLHPSLIRDFSLT